MTSLVTILCFDGGVTGTATAFYVWKSRTENKLKLTKTMVAQQQTINSWVRIAVAAAEQIYVGSGRGMEKKAHVIAFLKSKGITFDVESVDAMIEAPHMN